MKGRVSDQTSKAGLEHVTGVRWPKRSNSLKDDGMADDHGVSKQRVVIANREAGPGSWIQGL